MKSGNGGGAESRPADVAVIGGGAIGLAVAWKSASAGLDVTVVDPQVGSGASWAAAGMIAPASEAHYGEQELLSLNLESARRYPSFVAELEDATGHTTGYRTCGTLVVARDNDDNAALEDLYRWQLELGLAVQRLRGRDCRALEPGLVPSVRGGIFVEGDHAIDNRLLVSALLEACKRSGVTLLDDRAHGIITHGGRVTAVSLAGGGSVGCGQAVIAAGCWSGSLPGMPPDALPPVRPVKGQLLYLRGPSERAPAQRNIRSLDVYIVSRGDGRVVVGATVEELGFDEVVTAGAVHTLLRDALEILPALEDLEVTETVAGLRPASPDNAPLLGASGVPGLILATGHYRNGILLTPVTASAISKLLVSGRPEDVIAPFSPRRFERQHAGAGS
jgi:glycine oxidase